MSKEILTCRRDGALVAYGFKQPYEIACVPKLEQRLQSLLDDQPAGMHTENAVPEKDEQNRLPNPPMVVPRTGSRLVFDVFSELNKTLDVTVEYEKELSRQEIRDELGEEPIATEEDLVGHDEFYQEIADAIDTLGTGTPDGALKTIQRRLERNLSRRTFENAVQRTYEEVDVASSPEDGLATDG